MGHESRNDRQTAQSALAQSTCACMSSCVLIVPDSSALGPRLCIRIIHPKNVPRSLNIFPRRDEQCIYWNVNLWRLNSNLLEVLRCFLTRQHLITNLVLNVQSHSDYNCKPCHM
eukprot:6187516-Pleurochrysis_carterae.AAC.4